MDADEFLRRYAADPIVDSAELLKGVVHVTRWREFDNGKGSIVPPISAEGHGAPHADIIAWLRVYSAHTAGTETHAPITTIFPSRETGFEPDAQLRILPECGGSSRIGPDKFVHGVPELIAEISYSSGDRDLGIKYEALEADGVPEYLVWRTHDKDLDWFVLRGTEYVALKTHRDGTLRSEAFPGLWLHRHSLLARDMARVRAVLQKGLESRDHAAFVARLRRAGRKRKQ
jgi:hypothetical protein